MTTMQHGNQTVNEYLKSGAYCLKRASRHINEKDSLDDAYDSVLYFAFGMEKLFKGVLYVIDPMLILETPTFENAVRLLYTAKMIDFHRKKAEGRNRKEKNSDANVHAFKASMFAAAHFSQCVQSHIGTFGQLCDYRGVIVHRALSELDVRMMKLFVGRNFHPLVSQFAQEHGIAEAELFADTPTNNYLKGYSNRIIATEEFDKRIEALFSKHLAIWKAREADPIEVAKCRQETDKHLYPRKSRPVVASGTCPCCKGDCVLDCDIEGEYEDGQYIATGLSVTSMKCYFCDLELTDYLDIDYFGLNQGV